MCDASEDLQAKWSGSHVVGMFKDDLKKREDPSAQSTKRVCALRGEVTQARGSFNFFLHPTNIRCTQTSTLIHPLSCLLSLSPVFSIIYLVRGDSVFRISNAATAAWIDG